MSYWHSKVVLVTGGSAGFGLAITRQFAAGGARLVILGRDKNRLEVAKSGLREVRADVETIVADITQQKAVEAAVEQTIARFGKLDVLVNCAGKSSRGEAIATTPQQFQELWEVNFLAMARCTQAAIPHLLAARGHVVNIGSLASKSAAKYLGAYPASKFPVAAYSQQLRLELGPQGLHVLLVCPGPIQRPEGGNRYPEESANLPESARLPGGGVRLREIDPDYLAARILRACERRQAELVVPGRARLLFAIAQLWPNLGDWLLNRMTRG